MKIVVYVIQVHIMYPFSMKIHLQITGGELSVV